MAKLKLKKPKKIPNKIGFDVDGVLCAFNDEFWRRINIEYNTDVDPNKTPHYHYAEEVLGDREAGDFFEREIRNGLFEECLPYPEAQIFLTNLLAEDKHDIYFITARAADHGVYWTSDLQNKVKRETYEWLRNYFPTFSHSKLIFSPDKERVICEKGIELFVEDKREMADKLVGMCTSLLLNRSWNAGETQATRINSIVETSFFL